MKGTMQVFFKILTGDSISVKLSDVLKNEKVVNVIKTNFGKGIRGAVINIQNECELTIEKENVIHNIEIQKKDFQDAMSFVEEYIEENKLNKKDFPVEIVDIKI